MCSAIGGEELATVVVHLRVSSVSSVGTGTANLGASGAGATLTIRTGVLRWMANSVLKAIC